MTRETLSRIMRMAWQFIKMNGYTKSEALKTAWANTKLKAKMAGGIVGFVFRKIDGSLRQAFGTLSAELLPNHGTGGNRRPNETVQVYFDTEKNEFRSFKKANLLRLI